MSDKPSQAELDLKLGNAVFESTIDSVKELLAQGASVSAIAGVKE